MIQYKDWHYGGPICKIPVPILEELNNCYNIFSAKEPDYLEPNYFQWFVQNSLGIPFDETSWIQWNDNNLLEKTKLFFSQYVSSIFRFRFSLLHENSDVAYHFAHQLPRIHIPLNDSLSQMIIKNNDNQENYIELTYGYAYFVNVTKLHRVIGDVNKVRRNAFFSFTNFVDLNIKNQYTINIQ